MRPPGAIVPYLPEGYQTVGVEEQQYCKINNTYYLPKQDDGATVFQVVRFINNLILV